MREIPATEGARRAAAALAAAALILGCSRSGSGTAPGADGAPQLVAASLLDANGRACERRSTTRSSTAADLLLSLRGAEGPTPGLDQALREHGSRRALEPLDRRR